MESFAFYLLKSVIWLSAFTIVYYVFLRNERFFRLKRYFLLAGILGAIVFPLITFHYKVELPAPSGIAGEQFPAAAAGASFVQPVSGMEGFEIGIVLMMIYISGLLVLSLKLIGRMVPVIKCIRGKKGGSSIKAGIIRSSEFTGSLSFFNYIIINSSVADDEIDAVMSHELVHVSQKHWLDLLLAEMVRLFQWANPFAWMCSHFVRQNHEFLADEVALRKMDDPVRYKAVLLNQLIEDRVLRLSHSFSYSSTKKRFDMMKNSFRSPYRKMKLLLIIPVMGSIFYSFADPVYRYPDNYMTDIQAVEAIDQFSQGTDASLPDTDMDLIDGSGSSRSKEGAGQSTVSGAFILQNNLAAAKDTESNNNGSYEIFRDKSNTLHNSLKPVIADQKTVKGVVLNENGQPLEKVRIIVTGKTGDAFSSVTGPDGNFEIGNVDPDASIILNYEGYKVLVVKADFSAKMTLKLERDPDYKEPPKRFEPLVLIDGEISDINYRDISKHLGYDMGITRSVMPEEAVKKYGEKAASGAIEVTTRKRALEMGLKPPFPRLSPDDYPTFQGQKWNTFHDWVTDHVEYPSEGKARKAAGWVTVNFMIELDGTVSNPVVLGTADPALSEEVIRTLRSSPKWDPPKNPAVDMPFQGSVNVGFRPFEVIRSEPYVVVEQMPEYPGGDKELLNFIAVNTIYPGEAKEKGIQGRVIVRFIVNTEGNTEGISVLKGVDPLLDAEAMRVVSLLSGFKPGTQGGKPVPVWYMVPINFGLR
jgi:TonB family protein